jgi:hypothetical protein
MSFYTEAPNQPTTRQLYQPTSQPIGASARPLTAPCTRLTNWTHQPTPTHPKLILIQFHPPIPELHMWRRRFVMGAASGTAARVSDGSHGGSPAMILHPSPPQAPSGSLPLRRGTYQRLRWWRRRFVKGDSGNVGEALWRRPQGALKRLSCFPPLPLSEPLQAPYCFHRWEGLRGEATMGKLQWRA